MKQHSISRKQMNKIAHIKTENRNTRGPSLKLAYWNKGPSHLINKQQDIATTIVSFNPDIFGIGKANFKQGHNITEAEQEGYNLHLGPGLESCGTARVAVYTKEGLIVKRRRDLENNNVCTVWLQVGLPNRQATLYMFGYRQWQLPNQNTNTSGTVNAQLERWLVLLQQWERALAKQRETICRMDSNLDFLTWSCEDLPSHHSSAKLRPLTRHFSPEYCHLG